MGAVNSSLSTFIGLSNPVYCEDSSMAASNLPPVPHVTSPPSELPALVQQAQEIEQERLKLPNPGQYERAQDEVRTVLTPDIFEGCRIDINKAIGNSFAVSHNFVLGPGVKDGGEYHFGANTYFGGENPQDPSTVLLSRISPDGTLEARWHQRLSDKFSMRIQSHLEGKPHSSHATVDLDIKGEDYYATLKVINGLVLGTSYFQSITPQLSVGGEGYYYGKHKKSMLSYSTRYNTNQWTGIAAFASVGSCQLIYMRKVSDRLRLASEIAYMHSSKESQANIGAEYTFRQTRFVTNLNQSGRIASSLQTKILPTVTFMLSAEVLHSKNEYKFGYGLQLGQ